MQREHIRRGFSISHQKVVLEIDFSGSLWGYTEITIIPTSSELRAINLHSRQCTIHSVHVASHEAEFIHHDPLTNITVGSANDTPDIHLHPELKRKLYSALQEGDEGELSIAIPKEVSLRATGTIGTSHDEFATPEPQTPGPQPQAGQAVTEFSPIVVKIAYSLRNPVDGFEFVSATENQPYRVPHAYTTPSCPDAARCWVPCIDNLWEKCAWEFEFVVPRYLEERELSEDDDATDLTPTIVVCSGELVEQVAHPYNSHKTIFLFSQAVLTSVQHIAFAAGPFHLIQIPADNNADDASSGSSQPLIYAFCLPGQESMLAASTSALRPAMSFYTTEFGSYPFSSYKVVFVEELPTQRFDSATLALVTVDVLHGDDAIELAIEARHTLSHALACQWSGIHIQPKTWSDLWLVNGLAGYISGLFLRKLLGNNEYRFRLKKDMQRVLEWDNGAMPPICQPQHYDPPDSTILPFINVKAPLILHILDRRLGKSGTSLGLSRVLPKLFLSAISGEMQNNCLSTHSFLRMCRKVSGVDPRSFAEQWIYGSGCPSFGVTATFNRKKMAVEITMRQECPAYQSLEHNEFAKVMYKPVQFFEGTMTIRIHEADGTPYEHVLDIRQPFKRFEVPFNTKYKRVRRNTKRYLARQAAAQAAAEGDTEAAEAMGMVDMGFGLEIWEKEQERENWKVADWTEEDENVMSGATYEWIRMDADFEWIANLKFEQPDFMWVSQLQRDRDVVAQMEAVHALARQPTAIVSSTLTKTVLVSNYHYRIRVEAALALVNCAIHRLDFLGLFHLFKLFLRYCYEPEDPKQNLFTHTYVPKPNDFSDLSEYFVRKSLITAISRIRFENGKSPSVVRQFLIDQLRYNDNTSNPYSDAFYICAIISAAASASVSTAAPERGELLPTEVRTEHNEEDKKLLDQTLVEIERYRSMDRLIPSVHNIVTVATLEFYMVISVANLIPSATRIFFPLTREGNYVPVRITAFDALFLTKWYAPAMMRYILAVMAKDPSRIVRRHVARNACQSLALLVQMGELKSNAKDTESLLIEEDGSHPEKMKESKKTELDALIKVLRKDKEVGKNEVIREFLMTVALARDADYEVRWCVLKLADILIRGHEETAPTAPTVKLHIPPTPVSETPPSLPSAKIAVKPPKPLKSGGPPAKGPLAPVNIPPKIKLSTPSVDSPRLSLSLNNTPKSTQPPLPPIEQQARVKHTGGPTAPTLPSKGSKPKGRPPKAPDKQVHTLKAQAAGMSVYDLRACRSALKKIKANKHAKWFLQPVDPIRDQAPNYFGIIKEPMDLSTMGAKLEAGMYKDRSAFQADFRLMVNNAKQYNMPGSHVHNEAIALEVFFEKPRPVIKIKVGGTNQSQSPARVSTPKPSSPVPTKASTPAPSKSSTPAPSKSSASSSKLRIKKPKVTEELPAPDIVSDVDAPPPPYVDDGSHDLYQEVLAIEREKDEEKNRQRSAQQKINVNGSSSKRKMVDLPSEEDEILELATPSKKEKPYHSSSNHRVIVPASKPAPSKASKESTPHARTPPVESHRSSAKGKEREVQPSPTPPIKTKPPSPTKISPINEKKCKELLKNLLKLNEAAIFSRPVDPIADGCPTYLEEIRHPMDFGTMSEKLSRGQYSALDDFRKDIELVFSNCRQFNPPSTFPINCADVVERAFKKEWPKVAERKLSYTEKRGLQGIMTGIVKDSISWVFRTPVDPELLGIPTYFDVIPRKNARDLSTIRQKLDSDTYESVEAFEADIDLMIQNAITFNGADSEVGQVAVDLNEKMKEMIASWKAGGGKKRKDGADKSNPQPSKKAKLA
ncbi:tata-binding protein associated factor taf2 [Moniliophthora roreri]|nr:tata-binding protein associated factor taf2 [Moniliophthora roreri]